MTTADPLVAVVVLNWNGLADTRECLRSLAAQTWRSLEVWVVDNASQNAEADALEREFGASIRLLRSAVNLGFAAGCNLAAERVLEERKARYVAWLNNDAVVEPGWLAALVAGLESRGDAASATSRMVLYDQPTCIENTGIVVLTNGDAVPRGRGQAASAWERADTVLGACGGASLWRADVLREIGLFRADFFANFEDVDLALRAAALGWRCVYVPDAIARHKLSVSVKKARDDAFDARSLRNLTWAYCVNMPWLVVLLNLPWLVLCNVVVVVAAPLFGQRRVARLTWRGRAMAWRERAAILAERRRLAPRRRGSGLALWWRQRSFLRSYARFFWEGIVLRRRRFME